MVWSSLPAVHTSGALVPDLSQPLQLTFFVGAGLLVIASVVLLLPSPRPAVHREHDPAHLPRDPEESAPTHAPSPAVVAAAPLSNAAVVAGTVAGVDGDPMAHVAVTVTDLRGRRFDTCVSGPDGAYRVEVPSGGTYLLVGAAQDLPTVTSLVTVAQGEVRRDIVMGGATVLYGHVRYPDGRAAAATVTLTDASGEVVGTAVTGAGGGYAVNGLHAGDYTLTVAAPGVLPAAQAYSVDGVHSHRLDVTLSSHAALAGVIRSGLSGAPVPEASVVLVDAAGNIAARATTGEDGRYRFGDLAPGVYTLTASGHAPQASRVELGGDRTEQRDVTLGGPDAAGLTARGG